jgi:hypothetical protein
MGRVSECYSEVRRRPDARAARFSVIILCALYVGLCVGTPLRAQRPRYTPLRRDGATARAASARTATLHCAARLIGGDRHPD